MVNASASLRLKLLVHIPLNSLTVGPTFWLEKCARHLVIPLTWVDNGMPNLQEQNQKRLAENRFKPVTLGAISPSSSNKNLRVASKQSYSASAPIKRHVPDKRGSPMKRKVNQSTLKKSSVSVRQQLPRHRQLKALKMKDVTLCRYDQCVTDFKAFARRRRLPLKK